VVASARGCPDPVNLSIAGCMTKNPRYHPINSSPTGC